MPVYSWRRRPTKHFGEVCVPYAEVELKQADGRFQAFALQIDSGEFLIPNGSIEVMV